MIDTNAETALIEKIRQYDTPTICNAIEIAQGGRGFNAFTKRTMFSSEPTAPPVVGFARTARLRSNTAPTATTKTKPRLFNEGSVCGDEKLVF